MPKILLVDDDTELSELLANFLTLEGFRVTTAKTDQTDFYLSVVGGKKHDCWRFEGNQEQ